MFIPFLTAFTLHNIEEAMRLPQWSERCMPSRRFDAGRFRIAVLFVTLFGWGLGILGAVSGRVPGTGPMRLPATELLLGLMAVMMLNVVLPHTAASVLTRSYSPGTATGILLIWPSAGFAIAQALTDGMLTFKRLLMMGGIVAAVLGTFLLLFLGRRKPNQPFV